MAMTTCERIKKQRLLRKAAGWQEVRLWVPTKADATELKRLAGVMSAPAKKALKLEKTVEKLSAKLDLIKEELDSAKSKQIVKE